MKYKVVEEREGRIYLLLFYEDNTFAEIDLVGNRNMDEILKDAYILTNEAKTRNEYTGDEDISRLPDYIPTPKAVKLVPNFYDLTAKVYSQYGTEMDVDVEFSIDGTDNAKIEDGKVVVDVVDSDTSYFIVAKYGNLEERQERTIYAPREVEPSEIDILNKKIEFLASENEAKDDLLQEIILQMYS